MWKILGITTLDSFRVIDLAVATFHLSGDVIARGISMMGDIAIALAGIDPRITRVAVIGSTPDWMRPGMTDVSDPELIINRVP